MQAQVLVVAPFGELTENVRLVIKERFPQEIDLFKVIEADLQEAERLIGQGVPRSVKVIVSRGGTAKLLEQMNVRPVVSIQVSGMDLIEAVNQAGDLSAVNKIGVVGFDNMVYGCEALTNILQRPFRELVISNEQDVEACITKAINEGMDLVVGDAVSTREALKHGLAASIINSGKQAIFKALQEALLIANVKCRDEMKTHILQAVINKSVDAIIAVDEHGCITIFNPQAELIFHKFKYDIVGKRLSDVYPALLEIVKQDEDEPVLEVFGRQLLVKSSQIQSDGLFMTIYTLQQVSELQRQERSIRKKIMAKGLTAKYSMDDIIGQSTACQNMKNKAIRYALTESTILITGASGTGKEMLVQGIHNRSQRAAGPFVAVNCAAIPENLLESELFGYADGAFTGAKKGGRQGMFELAHGGTLFLDEIGEMPASLQARLLRVLQEREVMPLGSEKVIPIDVRVIAATNKDLGKMVQDGVFREDLYYRLNILRIRMPDLAERQEDIPLLVRYMLQDMADVNPEIATIDEDAMDVLCRASWPGNIRQLRNMVERIMLLTNGNQISKEVVSLALADEYAGDRQDSREIQSKESQCLKDLELETMRQVLAEEGNNYSRAAQRLGIHRSTLWRKLKNKRL